MNTLVARALGFILNNGAGLVCGLPTIFSNGIIVEQMLKLEFFKELRSSK
jgi:hypothetical protein